MGLAYAALGAAAVVWGLAFPIMKFAVDRLGPLDVGVVRMAFGAAGAVGLFLVAPRAGVGTLGPAILVAGILILGGLHLVLGARHG